MSIAEMMLDGTLCECCGTALAGPALGYPRYCSAKCRKDRATAVKPTSTKTACPVCGKRVHRHGLANHMRDAHKGDTDE